VQIGRSALPAPPIALALHLDPQGVGDRAGRPLASFVRALVGDPTLHTRCRHCSPSAPRDHDPGAEVGCADVHSSQTLAHRGSGANENACPARDEGRDRRVGGISAGVRRRSVTVRGATTTRSAWAKRCLSIARLDNQPPGRPEPSARRVSAGSTEGLPLNGKSALPARRLNSSMRELRESMCRRIGLGIAEANLPVEQRRTYGSPYVVEVRSRASGSVGGVGVATGASRTPPPGSLSECLR
jgi:hypothetical protein